LRYSSGEIPLFSMYHSPLPMPEYKPVGGVFSDLCRHPRSRLFLINNLCAAAVNILLGLVLIPRMGLMGAAIAVLVSTGGFQVALTIETWMLERVHPFTMSLLKPAAAALVAFAVEYALHAGLHAGPVRVTAVIAGGAVSYLAALLLLGLAPEERDVVRKLVGRLRRR